MTRSILPLLAVLGALAAPATASAALPQVDFVPSLELADTDDEVVFTATASDVDGDLDILSWDFDNDGTAEVFGSSLLFSTARWTFRTPGVKQVTLTATDLAGGMASVGRIVRVVQAPPVTEPPPAEPPTTSAAGGGAVAPGQTFDVPARAVAGTTARGTVRLRLLRPFPIVRLQGRVVRGGATIARLTVAAPRGARVRVTCTGRGCFRRSSLVKVARRAQILRFHGMERRLAVGAVIEIFVGGERSIGKYTRFVIRRNAVPVRRDRCVVTLRRTPSTCPTP